MSVFIFTVYAYGAGNIIYFQKIQTRKKVNYGAGRNHEGIHWQ